VDKITVEELRTRLMGDLTNSWEGLMCGIFFTSDEKCAVAITQYSITRVISQQGIKEIQGEYCDAYGEWKKQQRVTLPQVLNKIEENLNDNHYVTDVDFSGLYDYLAVLVKETIIDNNIRLIISVLNRVLTIDVAEVNDIKVIKSFRVFNINMNNISGDINKIDRIELSAKLFMRELRAVKGIADITDIELSMSPNHNKPFIMKSKLIDFDDCISIESMLATCDYNIRDSAE